MPEQSTTIDDDPFRRRCPTSHERMSGRPWDASYTDDGPAPWDIGRPQPAIARLASRGVFAGEVLDAGCGTGEHTLLVASLGLPILGVDVAETALAMARKKAIDRGLEAEFAIGDALHLERLGRRFDMALDCGLFIASKTTSGQTTQRVWLPSPNRVEPCMCCASAMKGPITGLILSVRKN